ncbi:hypothetical protein ACFOU0_00200 [Salinicoccus sesuvii]|uniref:Bacterial Pleckstrin homology domain-containing protein n=1 Tax=Salinicoccus sesuvii TaxID=868281 RepID=A0ABV7N0B8_9STAP
MIFTLIYILFAGLLLKSFHTRYISEKRKYFSFDDRRFTDDDYLKVQSLHLGRLENVFLFIMLVLLLLALGIHIFVDPVLSIWILGAFVATMMLLSLIVDFKLYTVTYDRSHLIMAIIWSGVVVGIFIFLFARSTADVDMTFEEGYANVTPGEVEYEYDEIEDVRMISTVPDIPFNHNVFGTLHQRHGYFAEGGAHHFLNIEDTRSEMVMIKKGETHIYVNDAENAVTRAWYENLRTNIE